MTLSQLTFHITDRCQLNCDHCLRDPGKTPVDLEPSLIARVVDEARELFGTRHVGLTGGEPTLHPRFYEILDAIVDRGCTYHVVSNGHRFEQVAARICERPERRAGLRPMNFSLDGATEATHDSIREHGNFRTLMQAILVCRARELPFLLQMTLNARNVHELEAMALLASQLGADKLAYGFTQPTGTFLDASMHLPASEWRRVMDRVQRVKETFKLVVYHAESGAHDEPFHMCEMWRHESLHVDYAGRLTLCCQHAGVPSDGARSEVCGDLRQMSLAEAHLRFTELVNELVRERLRVIREPALGTWDKHFSCNWCLKQFGRPHWTDTGVSGPEASRVRWRGRWKPGYKPSHLQAQPSLARAPHDPAKRGKVT